LSPTQAGAFKNFSCILFRRRKNMATYFRLYQLFLSALFAIPATSFLLPRHSFFLLPLQEYPRPGGRVAAGPSGEAPPGTFFVNGQPVVPGKGSLKPPSTSLSRKNSKKTKLAKQRSGSAGENGVRNLPLFVGGPLILTLIFTLVVIPNNR